MIQDDSPHSVTEDTVEGLEGEVEEDLKSFGSILHERVISIGSMPQRLRLITGLAIATGIAAVIATAVQALPVHFPMVDLFVDPKRGLVESPVPILVLTVVMLILAWTYLLSGALHSHWLLRIAAISAFSLSMWGERSVVTGNGFAIAAALLVGALWLWGLLTLVWDRKQRLRGNLSKQHGSRVTWTTFAVVLVIVTGLYVVGYMSSEQTGSSALLFTFSLSSNLTLLGIYVVPILLIAGVDFAEWGEIIGVRVVQISSRFKPPTLAAVLTLLLSGGVFAYYVWPFRRHPDFIAEVLLTAGALAAVIIAAVWLSGVTHRLRSPHVPFFGLALAAVIFYAVTFLYLYVPPAANHQSGSHSLGSIAAELGTYSYTGTPSFTFNQPSTWESKVLSQEGKAGRPYTVVEIDGGSLDPAYAFVYAFPIALAPDTTTAVSGVLRSLAASNGTLHGQVAYLTSWSRDHGWDRFEIKTTAQIPGTRLYQGRLWTRVDDGHVWVLMGTTPRNDFAYNSPGFDVMAATWAPHAAAAPAREAAPRVPTPGDRAETLAFGIMLAVAVGGLFLTRLRLGGRFSKAISTGSLYLFVATTLAIGLALGSVVSTLSNSDHMGLTVLDFNGVQWVIGLATVVVVVAASRPRWRGLRPLIGPLFSLNLALIFVALIYKLYSSSQSVAHFSVPQAVVLLIAFALDVILSGESITNAHSNAFPRHARVMLFFGYILMGSALTLYFSSVHFQSNGAPAPSHFEDGWPQVGLIIFGVPVLLTIFILKVLRSRSSTQPGEPQDKSGSREAPE